MFKQDLSRRRKENFWMVAQVPFNSDGLSLEKDERLNREDYSDFERFYNHFPLEVLNFRDLKITNEIFLRKNKILEIGFGAGGFVKYIAELEENKKPEYFGIEPHEEVFNFVREKVKKSKRIHLYNVEIEKFFTEEKFDFIVASHVIEHVINPILFLNKLKDLLKDDGKIILSCPNVESLASKMNFFFYGFHARICFDNHRWLPGKRSLKRLIEYNGLLVNKMFSYGGFSSPRNFFQEIAIKLFRLFNVGDVMVMEIIKDKFNK